MNRFRRYFLKQFIAYFCVVTAGLSIFFAVIHLIDRLDELMPFGPGWRELVVFTFLAVPRYFLYLLPMSVLVCIILTFAIASKRGEVTAYKAVGGDIRGLLIYFAAVGLLVSVLHFVTGEYVVPETARRLNDLEYRIRQKRQRLRLKQGDIWIRGKGGRILHARTYIPAENVLSRVMLVIIMDGRPRAVISAKEAKWNGERWIFRSLRKYDFLNNRVTELDEMAVDGLSDPDVFSRGISTPDEMGILELVDYRNRLEESGFRNTKLDVDIFGRLTYPVTCFFMMLVGMSIALLGNLRSGVLGAGVGVLVSLFYWLLYTFMLSLGYAGVVPPAVSAGAVPLLFTAAGIALTYRVPR